MIDTKDVNSDFSHHSKIAIHGFGLTKSVPVFVRLEWAIGRALDEEFLVAFEKEFRNRADPFCFRCRHNRRSPSRTTFAVVSMSAGVCAVEMKPVSNCDGAK